MQVDYLRDRGGIQNTSAQYPVSCLFSHQYNTYKHEYKMSYNNSVTTCDSEYADIMLISSEGINTILLIV